MCSRDIFSSNVLFLSKNFFICDSEIVVSKRLPSWKKHSSILVVKPRKSKSNVSSSRIVRNLSKSEALTLSNRQLRINSGNLSIYLLL